MPIIKRSQKGVKLEKEELDGNFDYIETELNNSPRLAKNASNEIIGITGGGESFPIVEMPVEVLGSSAVAASCSLTAQDEVLHSFSIPAGRIGVNSVIKIEPLWTYTNSANSKILKIKIAGITVYNVTRTASVKEAPLIVLANRNSLSSQIQVLDSSYVIGSGTTPLTFSINFVNSVTVDFTGQRANASDTLKLEYYLVTHFVGA